MIFFHITSVYSGKETLSLLFVKVAKIIHVAILVLSVLLLTGQMLLCSRRMQEKAAELVTSYGSSVLETGFCASSIRFTYPFGLEIKGLCILDERQDTLVSVPMAIAHFRPGQLLYRKLSISGIRLIHPSVRLYADSTGARPNYAFLTDLFGGNGEKTRMMLRANSIVLRNASFTYDILDRPVTEGRFDPCHAGIDNLNASISLKALGTDTAAVSVRKLRARERSGFQIRSLRGNFSAGPHSVSIDGLTLHTQESTVSVLELKSQVGLADLRKPDPSVSFTASAVATVTGHDFKAFIPGLAGMNEKVTASLDAKCDSNRLTLTDLALKLGRGEFTMNSSATVTPDSAFSFKNPFNSHAECSARCRFTEDLPMWLERQLSGLDLHVPDVCRNIGNGSLSVEAGSSSSALEFTMNIDTESGVTILKFDGENGNCSVSVDASDIQVGRIAGTLQAGPCSFTLNAAAGSNGDSIVGNADIDISSAVIGGYCYKDIAASADVDGDTYRASINFSDNNGALSLLAGMRCNDVPQFWAQIGIDTVRLDRYSLGQLDSIGVSGRLTARFSGTDIDLIDGSLSIDSLFCSRPDDRNWYMDNMTATLTGGGTDRRTATVSSDFANAAMAGDFRLSTLASSFSTLASVIAPTLADWLELNVPACRKKVTNENSLVFNADIASLDFADVVLDFPAELTSDVSLNLSMNERDESFRLLATIPGLRYNGNLISGFDMSATLDEGVFHSEICGDFLSESGKHFNLDNYADAASGRPDSVDIGIRIGDNQTGTSIPLLAHLRFDEISSRQLKSSVFIDSSCISFNSDLWELELDSISAVKGSFNISDLQFRNRENASSLSANGTVSADSTDILHLAINNLDMEGLTSLAGTGRMGLKGIASGQLDLIGLLGKTAFEGSLDVKGLEFMTSSQGDLEADFFWDPHLSQVSISGIAVDSTHSARTVMNGFYRPADSFIDMKIGATHTDLHFLNTWTSGTFSELGGRVTGDIRLTGYGHNLDLEGEAILEDGLFDLESIGARFVVKEDTLRFEPGKMLFDNIDLSDEYGHTGTMNCHIGHEHFHNFNVDLSAHVNDMMVYRVSESDKSNIFATVFAEGSVKLGYDGTNGLDIKVDASTADGTRFGFKQANGQVASYNFLTIIDRNGISTDPTATFGTDELTPQPYRRSKFNLDLNVKCDNSAILDLSMGSLTGLMRGDGNIGVKYNSKDGIMLNGFYNLSYGMCSLSLEDLIRKDFSLREGSYVRFNGPLMDTELNLLTYHSVNSATVYDLDPSVSSNSSTRVRCLMDITGTAGSPELSFDIDIPNGTAQEKDILASATATEEQRSLQFMYLLAIGRFYSYDVNADAQNAGSPSAMESLVNSAVNGQINRIMSSFIHNDKISLSSNLSAGSYLSNDATNLSNRELEGILEAHLLDNRLLVNGNFGYRQNAIDNTSNFIGDVEVRYKLLPRQGISLKGYNKSNDKYFSKTTLTTQGVGLVFERDF